MPRSARRWRPISASPRQSRYSKLPSSTTKTVASPSAPVPRCPYGYEATQNVAGHAFAPGAERLRTEAAPESRVNPAYLREARRSAEAKPVRLGAEKQMTASDFDMLHMLDKDSLRVAVPQAP